MDQIKNSIFKVDISAPTEFINCYCTVRNVTDKPVWIKVTNSTVAANTDHPFLLEHFICKPDTLNIQVLPGAVLNPLQWHGK